MEDDQHPDVEHAWNALGELEAIDTEYYPASVTTLHEELTEKVEDLAVEIQVSLED